LCVYQAYPLQNAYCLLLRHLCDDTDEKAFVKEYIKENKVYVKLGGY